MNDQVLENITVSGNDAKHIWSNYQHIYDWHWDEEAGKPAIFPRSIDGVELTSSVLLRDWSIALKLKEVGVKKVLDIGSDTGHFMAVLRANGIDAVGIDIDTKLCDAVAQRRVNRCYNIGIQDLIKLENLGNDYDCVTCLNILHAKWEDEKMKRGLIEWIGKRFKFAVLSDMSNQSKGWRGLEVAYDFNRLPVKFGWGVYKVLKALKMSNLVTYRSMHKLYKINNK